MDRQTVIKFFNIIGWLVLGGGVIAGLIMGTISGVAVHRAASYMGEAGLKGFGTFFGVFIAYTIGGALCSLSFFAMEQMLTALDQQVALQQMLYDDIKDIKKAITDQASESKSESKKMPYSYAGQKNDQNLNSDEQYDVMINQSWKCKQCGKLNPKSVFICTCGNKKSQNDSPGGKVTESTTETTTEAASEVAKSISQAVPSSSVNSSPAQTQQPKTINPVPQQQPVSKPVQVVQTDSSSAVLNTTPVQQPQPAVSQNISEAWTCKNCGTFNEYGGFCMVCGTKKS
jgi:hypothetical protein